MAARAGLAAFLLAHLHAFIIDRHHAHRNADLWRTVAEHRYPQLVLQTGEQIHAVVRAFLPADLVLPDGAQVQRGNDLGLPVQIIQRDTLNGGFCPRLVQRAQFEGGVGVAGVVSENGK